MTDVPSITYSFTAGDGEAAGHIPVEADMRAVFGKARPPVAVAINGHSYRSTVAVMSGKTFVPFRQSHRAAAGISPGDTVQVTLTLDTAPRAIDAPTDLSAALDAAGTRAGWDRLSYSHQREWVEAIEGAKKPETRAKRVAAAAAASSSAAGR